jgi:hypothetical protein
LCHNTTRSPVKGQTQSNKEEDFGSKQDDYNSLHKSEKA